MRPPFGITLRDLVIFSSIFLAVLINLAGAAELIIARSPQAANVGGGYNIFVGWAEWDSEPTELFDNNASKFAALVKDAWQKMRYEARTNYRLISPPTTMTALIVDRAVYFASSVTSLGGGSVRDMVKLLREPIRGDPTASNDNNVAASINRAIKECADAEYMDPHDGICGEIFALHLYYQMRLAPPDAALGLRGRRARIITWGLKKKKDNSPGGTEPSTLYAPCSGQRNDYQISACKDLLTWLDLKYVEAMNTLPSETYIKPDRVLMPPLCVDTTSA